MISYSNPTNTQEWAAVGLAAGRPPVVPDTSPKRAPSGSSARSGQPAGRPRAASGLLGAVAAALALGVLLSLLGEEVGWVTTLRAAAAVAVLTAVHSGIAAVALPRAGVLVRLLLGAVTGLAVAGIGVWMSGLVDWFAFRWLVVALPALVWLLPAARAGWRLDAAPGHWVARARRYGPVLWGVAGAWLIAAPTLAERIGATAGDVAFRQYYVDVSWHIALTAEGLDRAPEVYPWIPDVPIGYSWLFFGTLAFLGNLTGATAAQLVLAIGPTLMAVLVPVGLAGAAWVVSRSRLAAALAPLLFAVMRGPVFASIEQVQQTPGWVLINRDSTNALVLAVIVLLVTQARGGPGRRTAQAASVLLLFVLTFAAAGGRGGAVVPILGAAGLAWLSGLRFRDRRWLLTCSAAAIGVAIVAATFGVTRSSGSFRLDPLTFLPERSAGTHGAMDLQLAAIAVMLLMTASLLLIGRGIPQAAVARPVLIGGAIAGVAGLSLFGHPAFSQLYFFHACWPFLVVGLAVLLAGAVRALGALVLLPAAAAVVATQLVFQPPEFLPVSPWPVRAGAGALLVLVVLVAVGLVLARRHGVLRGLVGALPVLVVALQPWALPEVLHPSIMVLPAATGGTVSDGQLAVLAELRERSDLDDLVATNKHCLGGDVAAGCDPRWFTVAAFAERRVLVEGWSYDYTWTTSGNDNAPYWDPELLRANDGFIAAPNPQDCEVLRGEGVEWLYVDHREAWSPALAEYADLVAGADDASLYRLRPGCG
ncbi:hypothetical protein [Modestobacter sp. SYSU DS0511]